MNYYDLPSGDDCQRPKRCFWLFLPTQARNSGQQISCSPLIAGTRTWKFPPQNGWSTAFPGCLNANAPTKCLAKIKENLRGVNALANRKRDCPAPTCHRDAAISIKETCQVLQLFPWGLTRRWPNSFKWKWIDFAINGECFWMFLAAEISCFLSNISTDPGAAATWQFPNLLQRNIFWVESSKGQLWPIAGNKKQQWTSRHSELNTLISWISEKWHANDDVGSWCSKWDIFPNCFANYLVGFQSHSFPSWWTVWHIPEMENLWPTLLWKNYPLVI